MVLENVYELDGTEKGAVMVLLLHPFNCDFYLIDIHYIVVVGKQIFMFHRNLCIP